jgi:hypothetical protein
LIRNFHPLHNSCRNGLICILGWMASSIEIGVSIQLQPNGVEPDRNRLPHHPAGP